MAQKSTWGLFNHTPPRLPPVPPLQLTGVPASETTATDFPFLGVNGRAVRREKEANEI